MRSLFAGAAAAAIFLVIPATAAGSVSTNRVASGIATTPFSFNWAGGLTAPVTWSGDGTSNWDVLTHKRGIDETMQPTVAQHGADCSPPPATHVITTLADSVFICKNHVMTSITDAGYGADVLTPDHMVDFSAGESVVSFSVSTSHIDARDYFDVWITPFASNLMVPLTDAVDVAGPPQYAVRAKGCFCGNNTDTFSASVFNNFAESPLPTASGTNLQQMLPASATTRTGFELHISQNHIRFGVPSIGLWWVDSAASVPFTRGIVQVIHHSYDACKDQSTTMSNPCVADTWHWSNFSITNSVPFTIINGLPRSANPQSQTVNFAAPAPSNAFLRFESLSGGISVSFDGGKTFQAAHRQPIIGDHGNIHTEHFLPYFTPMPQGAQSVVFSGQNWFGGAWWVRDAAIWSDQNPPAVAPAPVPAPASPTPTTAPTGGGSNPTPTPHPSSKPTPPTGGGGGGGTGNPGEGGGTAGGGGGEPAGTGTGSGEGGPVGGAIEKQHNFVGVLMATVNPNNNPTVNVLLLLILSAAVLGGFMALRQWVLDDFIDKPSNDNKQ
jgi:hypothetical protein